MENIDFQNIVVKTFLLCKLKIPKVKEMPVIQMNNTENISFKNLEIPVLEAKGISKSNR